MYTHKLYLFNNSFHTLTFLILFFTLMMSFIIFSKKLVILDSIVCAFATVTFTIHFYETFHAVTEYLFVGILSKSVYMLNIPFAILSYYLITTYSEINISKTDIILFCLCAMTFLVLGISGFYSSNYTKNHLWLYTKLSVSIVSLNIVNR